MERLQAQELMCVNVLHVAARVDVLYVYRHVVLLQWKLRDANIYQLLAICPS